MFYAISHPRRQKPLQLKSKTDMTVRRLCVCVFQLLLGVLQVFQVFCNPLLIHHIHLFVSSSLHLLLEDINYSLQFEDTLMATTKRTTGTNSVLLQRRAVKEMKRVFWGKH